MKEEFRWIAGYEGLYQVSNLGRVKLVEHRGLDGRLIRGRFMSTCKGVGGYTVVSLRKDGRRISKLLHRLVAEAFIPNPECKPQVDHIDGSRHNCVVSNLRWVTSAENCANPITYERMLKATRENPVSGNKSPYSRRISQWTIDGKFIKMHESIQLASKEVNCCSANIGQCANGRRKTAGGYIWKYESESKKLVNKGKKLPLGYGGNHVIQMDMAGKDIAEYVSIKEASRKTGCDATGIARAISGRYSHCGGFKWRYKE